MLQMRVTKIKQRVVFDGANRIHREDFQRFRETRSWRDSPFQYILEYPYETIPQLCTSRILDYYLKPLK